MPKRNKTPKNKLSQRERKLNKKQSKNHLHKVNHTYYDGSDDEDTCIYESYELFFPEIPLKNFQTVKNFLPNDTNNCGRQTRPRVKITLKAHKRMNTHARISKIEPLKSQITLHALHISKSHDYRSLNIDALNSSLDNIIQNIFPINTNIKNSYTHNPLKPPHFILNSFLLNLYNTTVIQEFITQHTTLPSTDILYNARKHFIPNVFHEPFNKNKYQDKQHYQHGLPPA